MNLLLLAWVFATLCLLLPVDSCSPSGNRVMVSYYKDVALYYDVPEYSIISLNFYSNENISVYLLPYAQIENFTRGREFEYFYASPCVKKSQCCNTEVPVLGLTDWGTLWVGLRCHSSEETRGCLIYDNSRVMTTESPRWSIDGMLAVATAILVIGAFVATIVYTFLVKCDFSASSSTAVVI